MVSGLAEGHRVAARSGLDTRSYTGQSPDKQPLSAAFLLLRLLLPLSLLLRLSVSKSKGRQQAARGAKRQATVRGAGRTVPAAGGVTSAKRVRSE